MSSIDRHGLVERLNDILKGIDLVEQGLADGVLWEHTELKEVRTKLKTLIRNIDNTLGKWK